MDKGTEKKDSSLKKVMVGGKEIGASGNGLQQQVKGMEVTPVLVQYFDEHFYRVLRDGVTDYYPSVTTKLGEVAKPFLARWRGDIGNREADLRLFESQEKGKRTHNALDVMVNGGAVLYQPFGTPNYTREQEDQLRKQYGEKLAILRHQDEMLDVWKVQQWLDIVDPNVVATEKMVADHDHRDAGTIDRIDIIRPGTYAVNGAEPVKLAGGKYIVDYKTGGTVTDDVWLQMAPYAIMEEKTTSVQVMGAIVIHTGAQTKRGIPGLATLVRTREQLKADYEDYRHVAALWERKNKNAAPRLFDFPSLITLNAQGDQNANGRH